MRDYPYKHCHDKVYLNGELLFERYNSEWVDEGDRNFYCNSPMQLVMALLKIVEDMDREIKDLKLYVEQN
jgi:hypothetical protein